MKQAHKTPKNWEEDLEQKLVMYIQKAGAIPRAIQLSQAHWLRLEQELSQKALIFDPAYNSKEGIKTLYYKGIELRIVPWLERCQLEVVYNG